MIDNYCRS